MSRKDYFKAIWELNNQWTVGVLCTEIRKTATANIVLSEVVGEYSNYAVPTVANPEMLDLKEIKAVLNTGKNKAAVYLLEAQQQAGFVEYLVRNNFSLDSRDVWMGYDRETYQNKAIVSQIVQITPDTFADFAAVLGKVFSDFAGNDQYLEICGKSLAGDFRKVQPKLNSDFFVIYENNLPVAGAGMFYSEKDNFAYLHNTGTLPEYRGRGYQTDLIRYRINKAVEQGIDRIYTSVEQGGKSWTNMIKCDLSQLQLGNIFIEKS